jgi:hypothetical protein
MAGAFNEATCGSLAGSLVKQLTLWAVGTPLASFAAAHHTGWSLPGFSHAML